MHWIYYLLAAVVIIAGFVIFLMYRGYNKIRPKPIKGIPHPPFTHAILGHPDKMLHPLKHELRLEVCDSSRAPVHQLVLMKHASVFINDSNEVARVIGDLTTKGAIYNVFRYDPAIPDLLTSDGDAYTRTNELFEKAYEQLNSTPLEVIESLVKDTLLPMIEKDDKKQVKTDRTYTIFCMHVVCVLVFGYTIPRLEETGDQLCGCIQTLSDYVASQGIYTIPNARKVSPEDLEAAKKTWRDFLTTLLQHVLASTSDGNNAKTGFAEAIRDLMQQQQQDAEGGNNKEARAIAEIHQIFRHGFEMLGSSLVWLTFMLAKYPKVHAKLLEEIRTHTPAPTLPFPAYLEYVLLETLRHHAPSGNMLVRTHTSSATPTTTSQTSGGDGEGYMLLGGYEVPPLTPIHLHIHTLHHTQREWVRGGEFLPERWEGCLNTSEEVLDGATRRTNVKPAYPRCPFASSTSASVSTSTSTPYHSPLYSGSGFTATSLSYLPFSAGTRKCKGLSFSLSLLRVFLSVIARKYQFHCIVGDGGVAVEEGGVSMHSVIVPLDPRAVSLRVSKIGENETLVQGEGSVEEEEGWAKEDD
eukprot:gene22538-27507_t